MYSGPVIYTWLTDVDGGTVGKEWSEFSENGRLWPGHVLCAEFNTCGLKEQITRKNTCLI